MTTLQQQRPTGRRLRLFVSYARADKKTVRAVEEGLETLHHQLWIDKKLDGGQDWWDEILARIRDCDAMIIAVSPALLESDAATKEREYARQLGKPLLPVLVAPVLTDLLPPDLATLQLVDYTNAGPLAAFQLAGALAALQPVPPLPNPLPVSPPVPVSYLSGIANRVRAETLSLDDQLALVSVLRAALDRPREHAAASELIQALRQRRDLYYAAWRELQELARRPWTTKAGEPISSPAAGSSQVTDAPAATAQRPDMPAPGWYPDPSGRHRVRWFDDEWTEYAADTDTIVDDPEFES